MIDFENIYKTVARGLRQYLGCPVIQSNQNKPLPPYPFVSYTITMPMGKNNGTYGVYKDGTKRKANTQTWSISALSDNSDESVTLACKAREWLDEVGKTYLNDNEVIIQEIGSVTNRDNIISVEFEYKNGFDVVFWLFDTIEETVEEYIETAEISGVKVEPPPTVEELNNMLERRLDGEVE